MIEPPDDEYGSQDQNLSWTGMVGMITRQVSEVKGKLRSVRSREKVGPPDRSVRSTGRSDG